MARGWESKSVESSQADDAQSAGGRRGGLTPEQRKLHQLRGGLELSRSRATQELAVTESPVRRAALESALAFLEGELAKLDAAR